MWEGAGKMILSKLTYTGLGEARPPLLIKGKTAIIPVAASDLRENCRGSRRFAVPVLHGPHSFLQSVEPIEDASGKNCQAVRSRIGRILQEEAQPPHKLQWLIEHAEVT